MNDTYYKSVAHVVEELSTDAKSGLSQQEAEARLEKHGYNVLKEEKKKTIVQRFFAQFNDILIIILLIAAAISFGVALMENHGFAEPILILLIVIINAVIGVVQENKAEKALDALKKLSTPEVKALRDGVTSVIQSKELVVGDIVIVDAGDFVPADSRLVNSASLKVDESSLTGESVPVQKDSRDEIAEGAGLGDRTNMIYSSCAVVYGHAKAVVTATGMNTEIGKIADLISQEEGGDTPLQIQLASLGKYLGIAALLICLVIFGIGYATGLPAIEIFMISVSLAVSAIPEGLPAIVTIVLAIGVQRMAKRNAVVRHLPAVETLGSANVICSDKTGTLTLNQMTLKKVYTDSNDTVEEMSRSNSEVAKDLLMYGTLNSDGNVTIKENEYVHVGDPTETAIVAGALDNDLVKNDLDEKYKRVGEVPFDSYRKLMSTIVDMDGQLVVIVKGAFDELEKISSFNNLDKAKEHVNNWASQALRVLGVSIKKIDSLPEDITPETIEKDLTFVGLVAMMDPPREEAKRAVAITHKAGIKSVMITGDHLITASAIARELNILQDGDNAITGSDLAKLSDEELFDQIKSISVFARVSPSDKIRIVKAWQSHGAVVAMTGDGVNDAPALKASDIGCAMGITGTDVAKSAADMTLTDDNFATIVEAIKEGRGIYDNIKRVVGFLLGTNVGEILTVLFAMIFWQVSPLISMQLLWINLVTDSLPAIALGMEPVEEGIMDRKPKPKSEGIFANGYAVRIILQGFMFAALTLIGFVIGYILMDDLVVGRTMAFLVLALTQLFHSYNMRSTHSLFVIKPFTNKSLNKAFLASFGLTMVVLLIPPIANVFGLAILELHMYLIGLGLAMVPLFVMELSKKLNLVRHHYVD
jgi:Ca2+-transporting ATPase